MRTLTYSQRSSSGSMWKSQVSYLRALSIKAEPLNTVLLSTDCCSGCGLHLLSPLPTSTPSSLTKTQARGPFEGCTDTHSSWTRLWSKCGNCGASPRVLPIPRQSAVSLRFVAMSGWGSLTAHVSPKPPWCTAKSPVTSTLKPETDEEKGFPGRREN